MLSPDKPRIRPNPTRGDCTWSGLISLPEHATLGLWLPLHPPKSPPLVVSHGGEGFVRYFGMTLDCAPVGPFLVLFVMLIYSLATATEYFVKPGPGILAMVFSN